MALVIGALTLFVLTSLPLQTATAFIAETQRDLTGDGKPETLRVTARDAPSGPVDLVLAIDAAGTPLYRMPLRFAADSAQGEAFARSFFDESRFQSPDAFLRTLHESLPVHVAGIADAINRDGVDSGRPGEDIWSDIRSAPVTIFTFSPGGDEVVAIGWSPREQRFYRLLDCC